MKLASAKINEPIQEVKRKTHQNKKQKPACGTKSQIADCSAAASELIVVKNMTVKISNSNKERSKLITMDNKDIADHNEIDLKKIERKRAKKLAQKLKKAQRKELRITEQSISPTNKSEASLEISADSPVKAVAVPVYKRVLDKKERKNKKRQLLKEQKLAEKKIRTPAEEEATIFVGNLPVNTKRVQLVRLFQKHGTVNSIRFRSAGGKVLHKHKMRRAAGSLNAYVNLGNKTSAENALELNGTEFKGNHLRVTRSVQKYGAQLKNDETRRTVFVGNLRYSATEESLREIFTSCGEIEYIRCIRDGDRGCKGVAYVCFKNADAVGLALELKDTVLDERHINVEKFSATKLGAKAMRDARVDKDKKFKQPANNKLPKKQSAFKAKNKLSAVGASRKSKKSEFRGVKVEAMKKKQVQSNKKSKAFELARKIAPKYKGE